MSADESISDLEARLRAGDEAACRDVVRRFADRLTALARRRLGDKLRRKEDPEDVLQSALRSFFARCTEGQFHFESWEELWRLLVVMTARKCSNRRAYYGAAKRRASKEATQRDAPDDIDILALVAGREPLAEEVVMLDELIERVLARYDDSDRAAVEMMIQGHAISDVSARLGRAERTLRRLRSHVEVRLRQLAAAEDDP